MREKVEKPELLSIKGFAVCVKAEAGLETWYAASQIVGVRITGRSDQFVIPNNTMYYLVL